MKMQIHIDERGAIREMDASFTGIAMGGKNGKIGPAGVRVLSRVADHSPGVGDKSILLTVETITGEGEAYVRRLFDERVKENLLHDLGCVAEESAGDTRRRANMVIIDLGDGRITVDEARRNLAEITDARS